MLFELLLSNGHHVQWEYEPFDANNRTDSHAMNVLFGQKTVACRHLGSGRNLVWINPIHVVFAERKDR